MIKKRNPRNATAVIASRASKKRDEELKDRIKRLEGVVRDLNFKVKELCRFAYKVDVRIREIEGREKQQGKVCQYG